MKPNTTLFCDRHLFAFRVMRRLERRGLEMEAGDYMAVHDSAFAAGDFLRFRQALSVKGRRPFRLGILVF